MFFNLYCVLFSLPDCDQGFYGKKCNMSCGKCTGVSQCDHVTGFCFSGCLPGWTGDLCKQSKILFDVTY